MKHGLLIFLVFICSFVLHAQNELVSYYNSYSEVYGGMEDSGISRSESYFFLVKNSITLQEIYLNGEKLKLVKGDTLIINLSKFTPYHSNFPSLGDSTEIYFQEKPKEPSEKERYQIYQQGRKYYANVQYPYIWDKKLTYTCKKKTHTVVAKEGFDSGYTGYAP